MSIQQFQEKILAHAQHVLRVGGHCSTEETTKQALILPLLEILGFNPYDPTKVRAEYTADLPGVKNGERVDYALFCQNVPVILIEAKAYNEDLNNHAPQLMRYFNASPEVEFAIITNGREWRFFTDLKSKNVMDQQPFFKISFENLDQTKIDSLSRFCHDSFQADTLRMLAEESVYLSAFTKTITTSLKEIHPDFVRYVASHSNVGRQLTQKFIEQITPIVKQAVEKSVSSMVVSGLSTFAQDPVENAEEAPLETDNQDRSIVDPNNSKIITTETEQELFEYVQLVLDNNPDLCWKDTESYFSILYQNKTNRWVLRYYGNRQTPYIVLPFDLTEVQQQEISRAKLTTVNNNGIVMEHPANILRISGLINDSLVYCQDDDNFRIKKK